MVAEGVCTVALDAAEPVRCGPGDLVLVPHGAPHVLSDAPGRPARPLAEALSESGFDGTGPFASGGSGPRTVLVCGHFTFGAGTLHPVLTGLPPLLHVRAGATRSYAWLDPVLRHLEGETRLARAGSGEIVRRLSEILLIEVLRACAEAGETGALAALADPQLGRALEALHADPARAWTLAALARCAGLSRTLFAERFRTRLGVSPMRYLAHWRVHKARRLLQERGCSVAEAARRVGYASESAFHRAFREQFGAAPGLWRRRPAA